MLFIVFLVCVHAWLMDLLVSVCARVAVSSGGMFMEQTVCVFVLRAVGHLLQRSTVGVSWYSGDIRWKCCCTFLHLQILLV